ncbi:uncharacterized protein LOC141990058 isoform X2 [Natator depressus]|uniref:uncharacterized protein LOC141990058 isoform X2 n=1 Tax=Natator depressus TaxID=27790 RepID=UPI003EB92D9B
MLIDINRCNSFLTNFTFRRRQMASTMLLRCCPQLIFYRKSVVVFSSTSSVFYLDVSDTDIRPSSHHLEGHKNQNFCETHSKRFHHYKRG